MWQRPPRGRADQRKQFDDKLYVYLGGGSLTSANTDLAHGVVRRCKTWAMAMAVLINRRAVLVPAHAGRDDVLEDGADSLARTQEEGEEEDDGDTDGAGPPADNAFGKRGRSPSALLGCSARRATARRSEARSAAMSSGLRRRRAQL